MPSGEFASPFAFQRRVPFFPTRRRLFLFVIAAVLPALGILLYASARQQKSVERRVRSDTQRLANLTAEALRERVSGIRNVLRVLANDPAVRAHQWTATNAVCLAVKTEFDAEFASVGVASRATGEIVAGNAPPQRGRSVKDREWFKNAVASRGFATGGYQEKGIISGRPALIAFGYPVDDGGGSDEFGYVAFLSVDLNHLTDLMRQTASNGSVVVVADAKARVLARVPDSDSARLGASVRGTPTGDALMASNAEPRTLRENDGVTRLFAFDSLDDVGIRVAVGVPADIALAEARRSFALNIAGFGIAMILALATAWFGGGALERQNALLAESYAELKRSQERFRAMFDTSPIGIALYASDGRLIEANPAYRQMFGLESGVQLHYRELTHPDDLPQSDAEFAALVNGTQDAIGLEKRYRRVGEQEYWWGRVGVYALRGDDGAFISTITMVQDINRLKTTNRDLEAVLDATDDAMVMFDASDRVRFANRRFMELFDLREDEAQAAPADALRERVKARFRDPDNFARTDAEFFADADQLGQDLLEMSIAKAPTLQRTMTPVRDANGRVIERLIVYRAYHDDDFAAIERQLQTLRERVAAVYSLDRITIGDSSRAIIGQSRKMQDIYDLIRRAAQTERHPVLILGETGTGKELAASAVHFNGNRRSGPFVPVNCAAITESLIERELFGHEKGSFTGATERRSGYFEQADGGTIFFDEIGDMPLALQTRLLRVLQESAIVRVGGDASKPIPVDARVIAATRQNLEALVKAGQFREDLYYRIRGLTIHLPPLRERPDDIPLLAQRFLRDEAAKAEKKLGGISLGASQLLQQHDWKGNIRELENVIRAAVVYEDGSALSVASVQEALGVSRLAATVYASSDGSSVLLRPLRDMERDAIERALKATNGNRTQTAELLQIDRKTLYRKMDEYGLR